MNTTIKHNLDAVHQRIARAAEQCGRDPRDISLLAVSKTKPLADIDAAIAAGQRAFGENYVQEGVSKIQHYRQQPQGDTLAWHFIGPLQSNKSRLVAEHFDWIHTVDRVKIAQRLNEQRPAALDPLNVLIQVNISDEQSKSGVTLAQIDALADAISQLPRLCLRGLMAIPAPEEDPARQRAVCTRMAQALATLRQRYPQLDTLSLGMTHDMEAAIMAGSTLVRIGSAIFGARD